MIKINDEKIGIIIEVKYSQNDNLEADCKEALKQIERNRYHERLGDMGMRIILKYGVACYKRRCKVLLAKNE